MATKAWYSRTSDHTANQRQTTVTITVKKNLALLFYCLVHALLGMGTCYAQTTVGLLLPVSGLGDSSFNDMAYAGLIQAKKEYQFDLIREKCKDSSQHQRFAAMQRLLDRDADIIVANGWEFTKAVSHYAPLYPDRYFIFNDAPIDGVKNVLSTVFDQHEASFLAGALAALTSQTGRIGFIGGKDMPVIRAFLTGYREGAQYVRADITIDVHFLSQKGQQSAGFDDPALAYDTAETLYTDGVDIIFSVAGLSGNGIIRAAVKNKKFVIGVDADQDYMAKGYILTSVIKRIDRATFEALRLIFEERFTPGIHILGLKEDGVGLSPMTYTRHLIAPQTLAKIKQFKARIIAGNLTVTNTLDRPSTSQ